MKKGFDNELETTADESLSSSAACHIELSQSILLSVIVQSEIRGKSNCNNNSILQTL